MSPAMRLLVAVCAPIVLSAVAMAINPAAVGILAVAGLVAAFIAGITGAITAVRQIELSVLLRRILIAVLLRLVLTGAAVLILTRLASEAAFAVALVLAGGVAAAVLCEAFLLVPQRESVRA